MSRTGWEVLTARCSDSNGGLQIEGVNHDDDGRREFCWTISYYSVVNLCYDWSGCVFGPGAAERLEQLRSFNGVVS